MISFDVSQLFRTNWAHVELYRSYNTATMIEKRLLSKNVYFEGRPKHSEYKPEHVSVYQPVFRVLSVELVHCLLDRNMLHTNRKT